MVYVYILVITRPLYTYENAILQYNLIVHESRVEHYKTAELLSHTMVLLVYKSLLRLTSNGTASADDRFNIVLLLRRQRLVFFFS